jgi:protocatechuate 3,4-dioxygenase beta subunit
VSQAQKIAVPLLLLAAAGVGTWFFLQRTDPVVPPTPEQPPVVTTPSQPEQAPEQVKSEAPVQVPTTQDPVRTEAQTGRGNSHADAKQGVRGRVVLPGGGPAKEVPVYLLESTVNDPIKIFLATKTGKIPPPAASTLTDADGTFALGVLQPGKTFDVRIVDDRHPELGYQGVKVREDDWVAIGDLQLEIGSVVQGRVVEEGTQAGVPEAIVFLQSSQQSHTVIATPGRERGVQVQCDQSGFFRFANAPRQGLVNLSVEAPGFAGSPLLNQQVKPDVVNEITIQVVRGQPLAGVVVDQDGKAIANVTVTASGLSMKTPQTAQTVTDGDGTFQFTALREGPYQLLTNSVQHEEAKVSPVLAGDLEVKVVLQPKAYAKLRVLGGRGEAVRAYKVGLKRHFPNNPLGIGNVPEFAERRITPADYDGEFAVIRGLPLGEFVFQITDKDHAKTLSQPFTVTAGGQPPEVEAQLTLGATIVGRVVDDRGQPVANATVSTDMNGGFQADGGGFFDIFAQFLPEKHTKTQVSTDRQGNFKASKLAFADYMVRIHHPDFCEGKAIDISLANEGQVVDVGTISLSKGAIVEGITMVGGQPAGQVKVTVTTPPPEMPANAERSATAPAQAQQLGNLFSSTVVSQGDGTFRLLKRVPPGTYKVHASRQSGDNNPFNLLLDMKQTEQVLVVSPGQDRAQITFNLERR